MKINALVPIKLNSQRLKNKNILKLGNKPLSWHIFQKLKLAGIKNIHCYCSDEKIKKYIPKFVKFIKRSKSLDKNHVKGIKIYQSYLKDLKEIPDYILLAHTTSPFLEVKTIKKAINILKTKKFDSVFTVKKEQTFAWFNNKPLNFKLNDIARTQNLKSILLETSSLYIFKPNVLKRNKRVGDKPFPLSIFWPEYMDIDTIEDFSLAKKIIKLKISNEK